MWPWSADFQGTSKNVERNPNGSFLVLRKRLRRLGFKPSDRECYRANPTAAANKHKKTSLSEVCANRLYFPLGSFTLIRSSSLLISCMDWGGLNWPEPFKRPVCFFGERITIPPYKDSYVPKRRKITFSTRRKRRSSPGRFQYL